MRQYAALSVALACLMAGACQNEPNFDERFEKADADARQLQQEIDGELATMKTAGQQSKGEPAVKRDRQAVE